MQINLEKGAAKNVIDLINATNGSALTSAEIALGQPAEWTDPEGINTRNTSLTISAVPDSGYTGTVEVRYHRLDLASLASGKTLSYTKSDTSTLQTLLESVATQLGVVEEAVKLDVDAMPVVPEGNESVTINIVSRTDSLLYVGMAPVTVYPMPPVDINVNDEITTQDLDGFDEPVA